MKPLGSQRNVNGYQEETNCYTLTIIIYPKRSIGSPGEHWGGFGDSSECLWALKESLGEHLEELWRLCGKSWEALWELGRG